MFSKTKSKRPHSLSYRLASRFTALLIVSHIVAAVAVFFILNEYVKEKDRKLLFSRYEEVMLLVERGDRDRMLTELNQEDDLLTRVTDETGTIIYSRLPKDIKNFDLKTIEDHIETAQKHDGYGTIWPRLFGEETIETYSVQYGSHRFVVGISTDDSEDFMHFFMKATVIVTILASLLSLLFGYLYSKHALRPVRDLIRTIQDIRGGKARNLAPIGPANDELSEVAELFNGMITQINHLIESLQQSLDAIAHDLRTPITHLINRYEAFVKSGQATANREFITESLEETQRIAGLVTTLLELTEVQAGTARVTKTTFSLAPMLNECAELYQYVAEDHEATIEVRCGSISIHADRNRLKRAVANLIDNALKYSDKKVRIVLSAEERNAEVVILVEDNGWGIPAADREKVWERLYRGDASRSSQGMGLGLSFVKSIIELHGGHIEIKNRADRGTIFELFIPR
jgi:heavy metal sensor kinase